MTIRGLTVAAMGLVALAGCGAGVEGKWCAPDGSLTLKGGKITSTESNAGGTYKVSGKEVTLTEDGGGQSATFTLKDAKTLEGPFTLTKCD